MMDLGPPQVSATSDSTSRQALLDAQTYRIRTLERELGTAQHDLNRAKMILKEAYTCILHGVLDQDVLHAIRRFVGEECFVEDIPTEEP